MDKNQSAVINYLRFLLIILVIMLHAYTATQNNEGLNIEHPLYKLLTYNFSLLWGYVAVPFFFFLSGFLFFNHPTIGKNFYVIKWKKCFYTLFLPYIIWNLLTIFLYFVLQSNTLTGEYFSGVNKPIAEYNMLDFIRAFWDTGDYNGGDGTPILSPYWYVRNLMILFLLTPIIYKLNIYLRYFWLIPVGIVWLYTPRLAFTACSLLWFGLGTYFSIYQNDLYAFFRRRFWIKTGIFILLLGIWNVFFFYQVNAVVSVIVQRSFILLSIPVLYVLVYYGVVKWKWSINKKLIASSFFIYTIHYPLILALRKMMVKLFPDASDGMAVFLYLLSILVTLTFCYGVYRLLSKQFPRLLAVLCGNRG